ncbi:RNA recognition motif 2-domain-containing protein [Podospora conica]|nr:RNA recognition motif 2-domain-containing protein [Schizothecium conicum]
MSQSNETTFNAQSPRSSSGGGDSYKHEGTPDTRLTAFSPDDVPAGANRLPAVAAVKQNVNPEGHGQFHGFTSTAYSATPSGEDKEDPFVSPSKPQPKLSPTASTFMPVAMPMLAQGSLNAQTVYPVPGIQPLVLQYNTRFSSELGLHHHLAISSPGASLKSGDIDDYLQAIVPRETKYGRYSIVSDGRQMYVRFANVQYARIAHDCVRFRPQWKAAYVSHADFLQVATPGGKVEGVADGLLEVTATYTPDAPVSLSAQHMDTVVLALFQGEGEIFASRRLMDPTIFRALVEFSDIDDAIAAINKFNGCTYGYVHLWVALPKTSTGSTTPGRPAIPNAGVNELSNMLQDMSVNSNTQSPGHFTVPQSPGHFTVPQSPGHFAVPQSPGHFNIPQSPAHFNIPQSPAHFNVPQSPGPFNMLQQVGRSSMVPQMMQQPSAYQMVYQNQMMAPTGYLVDQTPTRRSTSVASFSPMTPMSGHTSMSLSPAFTPPTTPMTYPNSFASPRGMTPFTGRRQNAARVNRSPYHNAAGHHNQVDVERIRSGIDVRTTIMLRNIPNKVDQPMLKKIVDESSWGKYDFMYLRIDFANDCNVGYAFINFVDPLDIIPFVNARANQRWNCFKSDKVAEVSYATIQGKDCLVQKFRNSSVMLEAAHYRPKLYYTTNGPEKELAGQEEPFPAPDNASKMNRSCQNAEHVGLFTPNAGQHFRDEQRRRRSQYDRGTRLAALEEYDYDLQQQQQQLQQQQSGFSGTGSPFPGN